LTVGAIEFFLQDFKPKFWLEWKISSRDPWCESHTR